MTKQIVEDVTALRLEAQSLRSDARQESDPQSRTDLLEDAKSRFKEAIAMLQRELRVAERSPNADSKPIELRKLLSTTIGSLGGTYRDAKDYERAIQAYDEGHVEETRRLEDGDLDSYNLVQRLVVRLLKDPAQLDEPAFAVKLEAADLELDRQRGLGRGDSWFLADVVLIKLLRGQPADEILAALESKEAAKSFYESTNKVIGDLLDEGLGKGGPLEERLVRFRQMLQRRGGLRAAP